MASADAEDEIPTVFYTIADSPDAVAREHLEGCLPLRLQ